VGIGRWQDLASTNSVDTGLQSEGNKTGWISWVSKLQAKFTPHRGLPTRVGCKSHWQEIPERRRTSICILQAELHHKARMPGSKPTGWRPPGQRVKQAHKSSLKASMFSHVSNWVSEMKNISDTKYHPHRISVWMPCTPASIPVIKGQSYCDLPVTRWASASVSGCSLNLTIFFQTHPE
jgi:hypothetical protein